MTDSETPRHAAKSPLIFTPPVRGYLYGIGIAAGAVAVGYGVVTIEQAGLWLGLAGALLGTTSAVAAKNLEK